jgi:hypothetical protein
MGKSEGKIMRRVNSPYKGSLPKILTRRFTSLKKDTKGLAILKPTQTH